MKGLNLVVFIASLVSYIISLVLLYTKNIEMAILMAVVGNLFQNISQHNTNEK